MKTEFLLRKKIAFFNILKWFLASTFIGIVVGIFNSFFLKLLSVSVGVTNKVPYYFFVMPFAFYIVHILARKIAEQDTDYSTDAAIARINARKPISVISAAKAFFLPIITISAGGSAGKEAPCADVGAGVASFFSKFFNFNPNERRKLMICGVSAGFAGVFGVPISGALFGLEVLSVGKVFYEVMFPAFIAGITSFQVTHMMGVEYLYHPLALKALNIDSSLLQVMAAGLFFGLVSLLFIEIMKLAKIIFRFISLRFSPFLKCFTGGALVVFIALLTSPIYLGLGMDRVEAVLAGGPADTFAFIFKMLTTAVTFAAGGVGGIITPVFFIGAHAGSFFAQITGLNPLTFAALGLVSVLAGVANTPLAASVMAIELFGATIAPYAAVSCILSFLVTGQRSVFAKQKFNFVKDLSDDEPWEEEPPQSIQQLEYQLRQKNIFLSLVRHLIPNFKEAIEKTISETKNVIEEKKEGREKETKNKKKKGVFVFLFGHLFMTHFDKEDK